MSAQDIRLMSPVKLVNQAWHQFYRDAVGYGGWGKNTVSYLAGYCLIFCQTPLASAYGSTPVNDTVGEFIIICIQVQSASSFTGRQLRRLVCLCKRNPDPMYLKRPYELLGLPFRKAIPI